MEEPVTGAEESPTPATARPDSSIPQDKDSVTVVPANMQEISSAGASAIGLAHAAAAGAEEASPKAADAADAADATGSGQHTAVVDDAGEPSSSAPAAPAQEAAPQDDTAASRAEPGDNEPEAMEVGPSDSAPQPVLTSPVTSSSGGPAAPAASSQAGAAEGQASASGRQLDKSQFVDGMRAIDVEVDCGQGLPCKLLHVLLDVSALQAASKPFLGGYRQKQNGMLFHHATCQTPEDQNPTAAKGRKQPGAAGAAPGAAGAERCVQEDMCWGQKLCRETQTVFAATTSCQTVREAATQMAAPGLLLDCSGDRVLTPRAYISAAVVGQRQEAAALTIQRYCRGWFSRRRASVLRGIKHERDGFLADTAADDADRAQQHKRHEVDRRTHPVSRSDFALLSHELDAWRQQQTTAIKAAGLDQAEEQAALQLLLAKETRLLQTLDRLRVNAHHERRAYNTQHQLSTLAQPKTWSLRNGKKVLVHTPLTVRAAELQQLYRGLTLTGLSLDERLDVLLHVKWVVKEFDCALTRELVDLIDREADLLNRGRSPKTLDGLRRRIAGLFLSFCQNPGFNPEAARLKVNAIAGPYGPETFEFVLEQQEVAG